MSEIMIVMGSPSDEPKITPGIKFLSGFAKAVAARAYPDESDLLKLEVRCLSSHRNPEGVDELIEDIKSVNKHHTEVKADNDTIDVIVACAGMAAFLPSYIASKTDIPVIGVPLSGSALNGFDALCSIAQSPPGVPIAATAIDGVENGILLALRIIGIKNRYVREQLEVERSLLANKNADADRETVKRFTPNTIS